MGLLLVLIFVLSSGGMFIRSAELVFGRLAGSKDFVTADDMLKLHTGHVHVSAARVKEEFFARVDKNHDGALDRIEFLSLFSLLEDSEYGPVEIHLAIAGPSSLTVMWVTDKQVDGSMVFWRDQNATQWKTAFANVSTYDAGLLGWHKKIYTAVMSPLIPDAPYEYKVSAKERERKRGRICAPFTSFACRSERQSMRAKCSRQ